MNGGTGYSTRTDIGWLLMAAFMFGVGGFSVAQHGPAGALLSLFGVASLVIGAIPTYGALTSAEQAKAVLSAIDFAAGTGTAPDREQMAELAEIREILNRVLALRNAEDSSSAA